MWAMAGLAGLLLAACADTEGQQKTTVAASTWTQMTANGGALTVCQGCHGDPANLASGGMSLAPDQYSAVLAQGSLLCSGATKVVNPGDHTTSVLYLAAIGSSSCTGIPSNDLPMPNSNPAIAAEIAAWIDAGAPQ